MGKTMESVFWHEVGHLIADFNNQDKLGIENFKNHIKLERASKRIGSSIEKSWGGATRPLKINIQDSIDLKEKVNKCAMEIARLAYGSIMESVYLRQKESADEKVIIDCWFPANVAPEDHNKLDKFKVRRILSELEETDPTIKAAWQANYSNQSDIIHGKSSVVETVNERIKNLIYNEANSLNDLESFTHVVKNIYVGKYLNEIEVNQFEADIELIKEDIFLKIANMDDFNNFVREIRDIILNDNWGNVN